jgi:hypothetical protein
MKGNHMKFSRLVLYFLLLTIANFPVSLFSQEQSKTPRKDESPELTQTPHMDIYQILDQARRLSDEGRGWESREDEIRLQAALADCVWAMDQALGQRLLMRSFDLTVVSLKEPPAATNATAGTTDPRLLFQQISSIASRHDAKLDRQLTESWKNNLEAVADKTGESKADPSQLSYLLLGQSANYLRTDEQKARALFRQSVYLRVLPTHCFFLMSQRKRAAEVTDLLFSDALDVLAQRSISEANEILLLSSYLFSPDESISYLLIGGYNAANAAGNASALPRNSVLAKRYLGLLLAKLNPREGIPIDVVYFALKNLVPQYQTQAPELLNDVYAKMAALGPSVSKEDSSAYESASKDFSASAAESIADWEKRLQNADKIEDEARRDREYFTIIVGFLLPKKDFTRASVVVSRISNSDLKQKLSDFLNLDSVQARIETRETAFAVDAAACNKIQDPLMKVVALSSLAQSRLKQKATGDALHSLDQAMTETKHINDNQDRLQAQLMLVELYLAADSSLGFGSAAVTFKEINKFPDFNMRRANFSLKVTVYGLSNEIPLSSPLASSLTSAIGKMCRVNCVETFQDCRLLEEKKTRLWATFEAVRTALRDHPRESSAGLAIITRPSASAR